MDIVGPWPSSHRHLWPRLVKARLRLISRDLSGARCRSDRAHAHTHTHTHTHTHIHTYTHTHTHTHTHQGSENDFIQGIQLPGNILVSPIEITSAPKTLNGLQVERGRKGERGRERDERGDSVMFIGPGAGMVLLLRAKRGSLMDWRRVWQLAPALRRCRVACQQQLRAHQWTPRRAAAFSHRQTGPQGRRDVPARLCLLLRKLLLRKTQVCRRGACREMTRCWREGS